jgi:hypothetical protein
VSSARDSSDPADNEVADTLPTTASSSEAGTVATFGSTETSVVFRSASVIGDP